MHRWQGLIVIAAGSGLAIGLAWGGLQRDEASDTRSGRASGPEESRAPDALDPLRDEIAALDVALATEREARRDLELEVGQLRQEFAALERFPIDEPEPATGKESGAPDPPAALFQAAKLQDAGVSEDAVRQLRERHDQGVLDELYLQDQAAREGWLHSARYRRELQGLRTELREELGEGDYDRLLYAVGRKNRVITVSVLHASPAMEAGILAGDVIYSYDGRRVFDLRALKRATAQGALGSTVSVGVQRGDQHLRFFLPRGPLGITMRPATRPPDRR